jgi:uncharacterized LabA/DUF88 family protein
VDRCALFVDAGYVLADGAMAVHGTRHRESVSWDYAGLLQFLGNIARERTSLPLLRCYWYEATIEGRRTSEHDALADLPGLKLRLGRMRPGRREGVEGEIRRDLTTLARNNAISDALLVSAEEDLAQVVADVQDLGIRVLIVHITVGGNWTISRSLRQECDDIIEIGEGHLRPYTELVSGPEALTAGEPYQLAVTAGRALTNGHGPVVGPLGHQALAAGAPPAPPAIYTAPVVAEYQRAAQPMASAPQAPPLPRREHSGPIERPAMPGARGRGEPSGAAARPGASSGLADPLGQAGMTPQRGQDQAGPVRGQQDAAGQQRMPAAQPSGQPSGPQQDVPGQQPAMSPQGLASQPQPGPAQPRMADAFPASALPAQQQVPGQSSLPGMPPTGRPGMTGQPSMPGQPLPGQPGMPGPAQQGMGGQQGMPGMGGQQGIPGGPGMPAQQGLSGQPSPGLHAAPGMQAGPPSSPGLPDPRVRGAHAQQPREDQGASLYQAPPAGPGGSFHGPAQDMPAANGVPRPPMPSSPGGQPGMPGSSRPYPPGPYGALPPDQLMPGQFPSSTANPAGGPAYVPPQGAYNGPQPASPGSAVPPGQALPLADAVQAAHAEGFEFGQSVAREAPALWLEAVLARKPRMPSDLEARLLQDSALPIDSLLHDETRHALRRGFWDALERSRR